MIGFVMVGTNNLEESEKFYTEGTLFHAPKGERHGPHKANTEVISLTHFDGPLTVE